MNQHQEAVYNGRRIRIGTGTRLSQLRHDQLSLIRPLPGTVLDGTSPQRGTSFRLPWEDEDDIEPGGFTAENRSVTVTVPGWTPCPDCGGRRWTVAYQRLFGGCLVPDAGCAGCGSPRFGPSPHQAVPLLHQIARIPASSEDSDLSSAGRLADRLAAGYRDYALVTWPSRDGVPGTVIDGPWERDGQVLDGVVADGGTLRAVTVKTIIGGYGDRPVIDLAEAGRLQKLGRAWHLSRRLHFDRVEPLMVTVTWGAGNGVPASREPIVTFN